MKKLLIILITAMISSSSLAFNFDKESFEIDSEIKTQINTVIVDELNNTITGNGQQQSSSYIENEILSTIMRELRSAQKHIERNSKMRNRFPNRKFIQEQKLQKQRYEDIINWQIPQKISDYIKKNFDFNKISFVTVICRYVNETTIEVHFSHGFDGVVVTYVYTEKPWEPLITHKIFK